MRPAVVHCLQWLFVAAGTFTWQKLASVSAFSVSWKSRPNRPTVPLNCPTQALPEQWTAADYLPPSRNNSAAAVVSISHEGDSCDITIFPEESILDALERQTRILQRQLPSLPELPSDCRRGNCLTCAASFSDPKQSELSTVLSTRDGLSPAMSRLVAEKGYLLTCSSYLNPTWSSHSHRSTSSHNTVTLSLRLGENHALWQEIYASPGRFTTSQAQLAARSAMARVIRQSAERNLPEWAAQTEQLLQNTPSE
jgi:ferredoxin